MKKTKTVAKDGETTLKRAMEIVQAAFPVFLSVWGKAQEEIKENGQISEELEKFEEARYEVMTAGLDVEKRIEKSKEFKTHIGMLLFFTRRSQTAVVDFQFNIFLTTSFFMFDRLIKW